MTYRETCVRVYVCVCVKYIEEERFESHEGAISAQNKECSLRFFFSLASSTNSS